MRFAFTDDQLAFRDSLRDLLAKECSPRHVRDAWANDTGRVPGLWDQLVDVGVVGLLVPERDGGVGLGFVDAVLLFEETGRHAVPEPIVETAALGAALFGDTSRTVAAGLELVPWADTADLIVTSRGVIERSDARLAPHASVDGARRLFDVDGSMTAVDTTRPFDHAMLGVAAQQCGLAERMLELTADYVRERRQFGVPVGSFQAVKHHLANARVALEFARPLVYRAAVTLDPVHISMAKAKADGAALVSARASLQCHGAIGYTTEYDLHLYMKRAWALARSWGDARWHRDRVGRAVL
jgi:alkylation response protein AidB-like acyl-CoA dehydrogenase